MSWTTSENAASSFAVSEAMRIGLGWQISYSVLHHNQVQPPVTGDDHPRLSGQVADFFQTVSEKSAETTGLSGPGACLAPKNGDSEILLAMPYLSSPRLSFTAETKSCSAPR